MTPDLGGIDGRTLGDVVLLPDLAVAKVMVEVIHFVCGGT